MEHFKPAQFREHFPLICQNTMTSAGRKNGDAIVYFDNGATTQKPTCVMKCSTAFYQTFNANVHRASHQLSSQATKAFEQARNTVKAFINAKSHREIIWTKGTTESINIVSASLGKKMLKAGDELILAVSEHHANIVPWQLIAAQTGASIKVLPLDATGKVDLNELDTLLNSRTKIVCCAHVSNVLGKINPINDVINKAKAVGAITVIDGAQAVAHFAVDVQALDCDFYAFSAHKMFGPTGVGVLYGKQALLDVMPPYQSGGEMIKTVSLHNGTTFNSLPFKFEAGTPNMVGVIGFAEAIHFLNQQQQTELAAYEQQLTQYCYDALKKIPAVNFVVEQIPDIPVIAFTVTSHHHHDIATSLDSYGIAVRSGHHCAMPLMEYYQMSGCVRVSMAAYNTLAEIDIFIETLTKIINQQKNDLVEEIHAISQKCGMASSVIISKFSAIKRWDSRHREIMLLGKTLPPMDESLRNENSVIKGCESLAWLVGEKNSQDIFTFCADSEAKIIRGLLVIVLAAYNGKTASQIKAFDIDDYFECLGLIQHLSPSRGNGMLAIVDKIRSLAQ